MKQTTRKALGVLLCLMLLCLLSTTALAEGEHSHSGVSFTTGIDSGEALLAVTQAGSYYLSGDISISATWTVPGGTVNLCLNGHSISYTAESGSVILVGSGSTLNLYDCVGGSVITGGKGESAKNGTFGGGVTVNGGAFTMYGGAISGNSSGESVGGGVRVNGGSFTMYGGRIANNTASAGGGVCVQGGGSFTLNGGAIVSNTANGNNGGGVYAASSSVSLISGTIQGNSSNYTGGGVTLYGGSFAMSGGSITGNSTVYGGGGVFIQKGSNTTTFSMSGGSITGNSSTYAGGGLYAYTPNSQFLGVPTLEFSGGFITGNTAAVAPNVRLSDPIRINVTGDLSSENIYGVAITVEGNGYETLSTGVVTSGLPGRGSLDNFRNDNGDGYALILNGDGEAEIVHAYTVTWVDEDGTELETDLNVPEGSTPTYDGAALTKASDEGHEYSFGGWFPSIAAANGNVTYTAVYDVTEITYTISWFDWDDTPIDTTTVICGSVPTHAQPAKGVEEGFEYSFSHWEPAVTTATADTSYKAVYSKRELPELELFYTLDSPYDADGDTYMDYQPDETVTATIWLRPKADTTLQAFDLFLTNADGLIRTGISSAHQGVLVESGAGASTATLTRILAVGSDPAQPISLPMTGGMDYELATVSFRFAEGVGNNVQQAITLNSASNIAIADTPQSFTPTIGGEVLGAEIWVRYAVAFDDNVSGEEIEVPGDHTGTYHESIGLSSYIPVRANYEFLGWSEDPDATTPDYAAGQDFTVTGNTRLYAVWKLKVHTVTFYDEDKTTVLGSAEYPHGTAADDVVRPAAPTKPSSAQFSYAFAYWSPEVTEVRSDASYVAAYAPILNYYTVRWENYDGSLLRSSTEAYGSTPSYGGATPIRAADAQYSYSFSGWSPAIASVTGNVTYTAQYTAATNNYDVIFSNNGHGVTPDGQYVAYGEHVADPGDLSAEGYSFGGWYRDEACTGTAWDFTADTVDGRVVLYAKWTENSYKLVFSANGGSGSVDSITDVKYTDTVTLPSGDTLSRAGYTLVGWNTAANGGGATYSAGTAVSMKDALFSELSGDTVTLYALWSTNDYVITYELDGGVLAAGEVNPDSYKVTDLPLAIPYAPSKTGYAFDHWETSYTDGSGAVSLTDGNKLPAGTVGNVTITASFVPVSVNYTVQHWKQNLENDDYTLSETETYTGDTASQTTAAAKTYAGFTAQSFSQESIAGDGSTLIRIHYTRESYTVSYAYGNDKPGAPELPAAVSYKYGASVTLAAEPSLQGYGFSGWGTEDVSVSGGKFTMPAQAVTLKGSWQPAQVSYTIRHWQQNVDDDGYTEFTPDYHTLTGFSEGTTEAIARSYEGFTAQPFEQKPIAPDGSTVVDIYYDRNSYTVHYAYAYGTTSTASALRADAQYRFGAAVNVAPDGTANGYTFKGWTPTGAVITNGVFTMPAQNVTLTGSFEATQFTISFDVSGGTALADMSYTIESADRLPAASRALYTFRDWTVTSAEGNWVLGMRVDADTALAGRYGNVTLKANWDFSYSYEIEEYKYAPTGYVMLRLNGSSLAAGECFRFDDAVMYYTQDINYLVGEGDACAFYTLIPASGNVSNFALTDEGRAKVSIVQEARQAISLDGKINSDAVVNVADANAVFQMLAQASYGGYYSLDQLSILNRLAADMVSATANADHRGSIADVNAIVELVRENTAN